MADLHEEALETAATDNTKAAGGMPTTYDPKEAETKWYEYWKQNGYFEAGKRPDKETFTIEIPPPNVT